MKRRTPKQNREKLFKNMWAHYIGNVANLKFVEANPLIDRTGQRCLGYADYKNSLYTVGLDYMAKDWLFTALHELAHVVLGHVGPGASKEHSQALHREISAGELSPVVRQMRGLTEAVRSKTRERQADAWARKERKRWEPLT